MLAYAVASAQTPNNDAPAPVAYASASELNSILAQVRQTSQNIDADLGKTRIEKWKADSAIKGEILHNAESVRRNLQSAMPDMLTQLSNAPEDLAASFKLYRNLDALYDVFGQVVESGPSEAIHSEPLHPYTQALISAVLVPEVGRQRDRIVLKGDVPSPVNPPAGCRFHTRCPFVMDICRQTAPPLTEQSPGHRVACHLYPAPGPETEKGGGADLRALSNRE